MAYIKGEGWKCPKCGRIEKCFASGVCIICFLGKKGEDTQDIE